MVRQNGFVEIENICISQSHRLLRWSCLKSVKNCDSFFARLKVYNCKCRMLTKCLHKKEHSHARLVVSLKKKSNSFVFFCVKNWNSKQIHKLAFRRHANSEITDLRSNDDSFHSLNDCSSSPQWLIWGCRWSCGDFDSVGNMSHNCILLWVKQLEMSELTSSSSSQFRFLTSFDWSWYFSNCTTKRFVNA